MPPTPSTLARYLPWRLRAAIGRWRHRPPGVLFAPTAQLRGPRELFEFEPPCEIDDYAILFATRGPIRIGARSRINAFCVLFGSVGLTIGRDVQLAPHCVIAGGNHDFHQTGRPMRWAGDLSKGPIVIEDDVWVGACSVITDGIRVGRGAVIGANSTVTRDVPPGSVVAGCPARIIGQRGESASSAASHQPADRSDAA